MVLANRIFLSWNFIFSIFRKSVKYRNYQNDRAKNIIHISYYSKIYFILLKFHVKYVGQIILLFTTFAYASVILEFK